MRKRKNIIFFNLIKIYILFNFSDLGAQIDGFIALAAHTVVARADQTSVVEGKKADVVLAAY